MDGFELLKLLRQDARGRHLRVLILSARTGHQDQVESLQLGANAYVFKPFSPRDLIRQVHALLADDEEVGAGD
jgi:DNA-binding response OmpR family regulator